MGGSALWGGSTRQAWLLFQSLSAEGRDVPTTVPKAGVDRLALWPSLLPFLSFALSHLCHDSAGDRSSLPLSSSADWLEASGFSAVSRLAQRTAHVPLWQCGAHVYSSFHVYTIRVAVPVWVPRGPWRWPCHTGMPPHVHSLSSTCAQCFSALLSSR